MKEQFISIIIPALNEERYITKTLEAVRELHYPQDMFEIILADNGSTDRTREIAQSFGARVIECPKRGVSLARNLGAREAKGTILAFLDADCVPQPDWLEQALRSVCEIRSITGAEYGVPDDAGWIERAWFTQGSLIREEVTHINAGNMIVPKDLFNEIGGFDESLVSGEDYEFCARARTGRGVPTIADSKIKVVHLGNPKTIGRLLQREIWHGLGALGSFRLNWFDKPLIATLIFLICTLIQAIGLIAIIFGRSWLFMLGTSGAVAIVAATVWYRRRSLTGPLHALQLAILYYAYYFGRSIALIFLLIGKRDYLRRK